MPKKPETYDHLASRKKPVRKHVWMAMDSDLAEEESEQRQRVATLKVRAKHRPEDEEVQAELVAAEEKLEQLEKKLRADAVKFVFRSLGRRKYDEIINDNQATEEQQAEVRKDDPDAVLEFNPETFPPALVAACIESPELSKEEVQKLFDSDDWNSTELMVLFQTALAANIARSQVNLGNG